MLRIWTNKKVDRYILTGLNLPRAKCFHRAIIQDFEEFVPLIKTHDLSHLLPVLTKRTTRDSACEPAQNATPTVRSQTKALW